MDTKRWIIFAVIVVAVIGGMVYFSPREKLDVSDISADASAKVIKAEERNGNIGDHVFGNGKDRVVLLEYGDFQCNPGCRLFHENFAPIMQDENYKDRITFIYRNFPITQIHPNAMSAIASAEAAGLQDKYWQMWDALFTNQAEWSAASPSERDGYFENYATGLGANLDKFRADYTSPRITQKIRFDQALGKAAGVTGTPSVFLNGKAVDGSKISSTEAIKALLDEALEKK